MFLQKTLTTYEDWPKAMVTKQTYSECAFILRGTDRGRPAWHCILVPASQIADLNAHPQNTTADITKFGSIIQYLNNRDQIILTSGWGIDPPRMIQEWIEEHYSAAIDRNIDFVYKNDDIRLCTMQRAIPQQKIGVYFNYLTQHRFHYIKLTDNLPSSLARRAGLKDYDRIISFNGVNVESDTHDQLVHRFHTERHLPVQMLACSPATYAHYKENNKLFHNDLPIIQRLKPVYATTSK
ncbi:unnamed protein product [Rotaria sp. Silwood1]|nr:unnamed protein product [Rotaria sp. Silwood1]